MESEIFGHEKGSFTGADRQHQGFFERAHGGTLFLDEITEMPLDLQVKLLRVLETGTFKPRRFDDTQTTDVRVIAATNRDPEEAVARASCARTCSIASTFSRSDCRRCAIGPRTSSCSPSISWRKICEAESAEAFLARRLERWRRTTGRATCASCATSCSAPS